MYLIYPLFINRCMYNNLLDKKQLLHANFENTTSIVWLQIELMILGAFNSAQVTD